jgi:tripartite-type tricarboxylate transporter receptor subunit TctC
MGLDRRRLLLGTTLLAMAPTSRARAQTYPTRPVRVIVPVSPGGANDTTARLFAQKLSENFGQQFYVENVVGAGSNIGTGMAARAPADGYTILGAGGNYVINPSLYARIPFDPYKDFAPVSLLCASPHVLAVHPSVPANNLQEFVALVKSKPGQYTYSSAGRGTPAHLSGELIRLAFDIDLAHVPFGGGGPAITATIGGHVPVAVSAVPTAMPYVRAGNVRALAVLGARRSSVMPDVPTMAEAGQPLEADIVTGFLVPAGTPREVVEALYREIAKISAEPDFRARLLELGFEPVASAPDEFAAWIKVEIDKWGKVVRDAKLTLQ